MALPILESPKYTLTIPSTKKSVEYRPFLVKEEKILMLAQQSNDQKQIMSSIESVVEACTFGTVKAKQLTSFDLEYIFLKLRAKSVGEISDIRCKCEKCEEYTEVSVNIDEIEVTWPTEKVDSKVMLTDKIGVVLRHILVGDMSSIVTTEDVTVETVTDMIIASIESIFDESAVYPSDQSTHKELLEFVNSLSRSQLTKIEKFIENAPKLQHAVEFTCKPCGHANNFILTGAQAFFE
jgi:hypothetical protein